MSRHYVSAKKNRFLLVILFCNHQYASVYLTVMYAVIDCLMLIPVAARSKVRVFGSSLAGIARSNSTEGMNICLCLLRYRPKRRADHSSGGAPPIVVYLSVISKSQQ
jgi:hypothetical protein